MVYKLTSAQQQDLRNMPETGMGYQLIEARPLFELQRKEFLVLNSALIVEDTYQRKTYLKQIFSRQFKFLI